MADSQTPSPSFPPYSPSWIDRLTAWIEPLPGPTWAFYLLVAVVFLLSQAVVVWVDGMIPFPEIDLKLASEVFYPVYYLWVYRYLGRVCSASFEKFRPLLAQGPETGAAIEYRLRVLPVRLGWISVVLAIALLLLSPESSADEVYLQSINTVLPFVWDFIVFAFTISLFFALLLRSIRQLRQISDLQRQAENIDLLDLDPPHAFAALTSRTGIALIVLLLYGFVVSPVPGDAPPSELVFLFTMNFSISAVAAGIFTIPLIGMRARLVDAKQARLNEVNALLRTATARMHAQVESGAYDGITAANAAVEGLAREREQLQKIPTWPWDTGTLRGFASTLLLPIALWVITRLLERLI